MGVVSKDDGWRLPGALWARMQPLLLPCKAPPKGGHLAADALMGLITHLALARAPPSVRLIVALCRWRGRQHQYAAACHWRKHAERKL